MASQILMKKKQRNDKYKLIRKIGSGGFGKIYLGKNIRNGEEVAVKVEPAARSYSLQTERTVYKTLHGGIGIPNVLEYGEGHKYNYLIMNLLGPSLEDLFKICNKAFTLKTVLMIADKIFNLIEYVHNKSYIHRDLKPDNFLMGMGAQNDEIFIIDFGLAKQYRNPVTLEHIKLRKDMNFIGTQIYASIRTHKGIELSRRDDLESIAYLLIYLAKGFLPWQGIDGSNRTKVSAKIMHLKEHTPAIELCKSLPHEFKEYLTYCRTLRFNETPNYKYIRSLFQSLYKSLNYMPDGKYDWDLLKYKSTK